MKMVRLCYLKDLKKYTELILGIENDINGSFCRRERSFEMCVRKVFLGTVPDYI